MAGTPKKRAKRTAAAAKAKADASVSGGSRAKPAAKRAARRARVRASFEPATTDDYAEVEAEVEAAALKLARSRAADAGPLTAAERVERDQAIVAAHALSMRPTVIAQKFGITDDHVRVILAAHRERRATVPSLASSELLADALEALEAQMERLTLLMARDKTQAPAIVGAVRTWREMWLSRLELLQIMGRIQTQPASAEHERRAGELLRALLTELRRRGVDEDLLREAAEEVILPENAGPNVRALEAGVR